MTDAADQLTTADLRKTLKLVRTTLDAMGTPPREDQARDRWVAQLGRLQGCLAGIVAPAWPAVARVALDLLRNDAQALTRSPGMTTSERRPAWPAPPLLWVGGGTPGPAARDQDRGCER